MDWDELSHRVIGSDSSCSLSWVAAMPRCVTSRASSARDQQRSSEPEQQRLNQSSLILFPRNGPIAEAVSRQVESAPNEVTSCSCAVEFYRRVR